MTTCRKSARLKASNNNHLFYLLQVIHEFRHPLRRCSCLLAATRPAFLPRDRSLAASDLPARHRHPLASDRCGGGSSAAMPTARPPTVSPTPPGRSGPSSAVRPWSMAGRPTAMSTAAASPSAASRSTSKIGDYWGSCGHPSWNGRIEQAVVGRVRHLDHGPFGHQRGRLPARRPPRRLSRGALRSPAEGRARCLRAARAQRIFAQARRSRLHRHGRTDLAPCRFAHGAAAHRQHRQPLRHRHRRARRLRAGDRRQREGQRDHEPLPVDSRGRLVPFAGRPGSWWWRSASNFSGRRVPRPRRSPRSSATAAARTASPSNRPTRRAAAGRPASPGCRPAPPGH